MQDFYLLDSWKENGQLEYINMFTSIKYSILLTSILLILEESKKKSQSFLSNLITGFSINKINKIMISLSFGRKLLLLTLLTFLNFCHSRAQLIAIEKQEKGKGPVDQDLPNTTHTTHTNEVKPTQKLIEIQGKGRPMVQDQKRENKMLLDENLGLNQNKKSQKISIPFLNSSHISSQNTSPGDSPILATKSSVKPPIFVIQAPVLASNSLQKQNKIGLTDRLIGNILSPIFSFKNKPQKQVIISANPSDNSTKPQNSQSINSRPLTTQQLHEKITNNIINNIFIYLMPKPDHVLYNTGNGEKIRETNKINFTSKSNSNLQKNSTVAAITDQTQSNVTKKGIRIPLREEDITQGNNSSTLLNSSKSLIGQANLKYQNYLIKYKPNQKTQKQDIIVYRETIFNLNVKNINQHNLNPLKAFTKGINAFTDLSPQQFDRLYAKLLLPTALTKQPQNQNLQLREPPKIKIDWSCRAGQLISQGICGVCHVITAVQSIQIAYSIFGSPIPSRSIQQVMSCSDRNRDDMRGCGGGYFTGAYDYIRQNGVGQSSMYPYDDLARFNSILSNCNREKIISQQYRKDKISIVGSKRINYGDCQQIVKQLKFRPIAVAIASSGLQLYNDGVFSQPSQQKINHGVVLVGYDYNLWPGGAYLIKNTWGNSWGNQGYAYISNTTGLCKFAMYPILNQTEPALLESCQEKNNNN